MPSPIATAPRLRSLSPSCSPPAGGAPTASPSSGADPRVREDFSLAANARKVGVGEQELRACTSPDSSIEAGTQVYLQLDPAQISLVPVG